MNLLFLLGPTEITEITEIFILPYRAIAAKQPFCHFCYFCGTIIISSQKFLYFCRQKHAIMTDNEITYEIRGAIYDVYKNLGPGLLESVYEEALVYELEKRGLKVERQKEVPINYDGHVLNTQLRIDLLVEERVVIELKSVKEMQDVFWKQTRTYLRLLNLKVGILVNFNTDNILEDSIHRVIN